MNELDRDKLMRMAAFERVRRLAEIHPALTATELKPGFTFGNERIPLINPQRGIFKPHQMRFLLSVKTVFPKPPTRCTVPLATPYRQGIAWMPLPAFAGRLPDRFFEGRIEPAPAAPSSDGAPYGTERRVQETSIKMGITSLVCRASDTTEVYHWQLSVDRPSA